MSVSRLHVLKREYSHEFLLDVEKTKFLRLTLHMAKSCGTLVCSEGLHHHRPPILHLAHCGDATKDMRERRGVSMVLC